MQSLEDISESEKLGNNINEVTNEENADLENIGTEVEESKEEIVYTPVEEPENGKLMYGLERVGGHTITVNASTNELLYELFYIYYTIFLKSYISPFFFY